MSLVDDIPLFGMIKSRMGYLSQRQDVLSRNVANSDTPGFTPSDLKAFSFDAKMQAQGGATGASPVQAARTDPAHMEAKPLTVGPWREQSSPDNETTLDGNSVVLEEEMMRLNQAKMDYDTAVSFYQKSMGLLRLAVRKPGG